MWNVTFNMNMMHWEVVVARGIAMFYKFDGAWRVSLTLDSTYSAIYGLQREVKNNNHLNLKAILAALLTSCIAASSWRSLWDTLLDTSRANWIMYSTRTLSTRRASKIYLDTIRIPENWNNNLVYIMIIIWKYIK